VFILIYSCCNQSCLCASVINHFDQKSHQRFSFTLRNGPLVIGRVCQSISSCWDNQIILCLLNMRIIDRRTTDWSIQVLITDVEFSILLVTHLVTWNDQVINPHNHQSVVFSRKQTADFWCHSDVTVMSYEAHENTDRLTDQSSFWNQTWRTGSVSRWIAETSSSPLCLFPH